MCCSDPITKTREAFTEICKIQCGTYYEYFITKNTTELIYISTAL